MSESTPNSVDEAEQAAKKTIRAARASASEALHHASDGVAETRDEAASAIKGAAARARDATRDVSEQLRGTAGRASDSMAKYIQQEPVKAVLLAGVAGAALVAVAALLGASRSLR